MRREAESQFPFRSHDLAQGLARNSAPPALFASRLLGGNETYRAALGLGLHGELTDCPDKVADCFVVADDPAFELVELARKFTMRRRNLT